MAYADPSNLITVQLGGSRSRIDSRLTRLWAVSFVVHAVVLLGLMNVRFAPPLQQPLASYQVDLITLPEPIPASNQTKRVPRKEAPVLPSRTSKHKKAQAQPSVAKKPIQSIKRQDPVTLPPSSRPKIEPKSTPIVKKSVEPINKPSTVTAPPPSKLAPKAESTPLEKETRERGKTPAPATVPKQPVPFTQKPLPPVKEPIHTEPVTPAIVQSLENIALPQNREMPSFKETAPPSTKRPPSVGSSASSRQSREEQDIVLPVVPNYPQFSKSHVARRPVSPVHESREPDDVPSLTESFKQTVQSVAIPQQPKAKSSSSPPDIPVGEERGSTSLAPVPTTSLKIPGHAPELAQIRPEPQAQPVPPSTTQENRVVDSLKQVVQSVSVPELKKPQVASSKEVLAVPVPVPSPVETQPKRAKKLKGIVLPPEAPPLATIDDVRPEKKEKERTVQEELEEKRSNEVEQKIAKLAIPAFKVSEPHHILSRPTESGIQNTTTNLQISGSSPEGHAYWGRVWAKIDREWVAPPVHVRPGQPLHVVLAFRLHRDGAVTKLRIAQSSGNEYYDIAAKRAVVHAAPLPPFPKDMVEAFYDIQFQFTVNLDSSS